MKKETTIKLIVVTMLTVLLSAGSAMAKGKKIEFEGTRCQTAMDFTKEEVNDRVILSISESVFTITTGNELVDGVWFNYDTKLDRKIVEYATPFNTLGNGSLVGRCIIIPDAVNGYWQGEVQTVHYGDDVFYWATLNGKGDLTGMQLVIDMKNPEVSETGLRCSTGGWQEWYGYILKPHWKWKPSYK